MAIFDVVTKILGVFLSENSRNWLDYKFVRPPLEISSNYLDRFGRIGSIGFQATEFVDAITITNLSGMPVRIRRIEVDKKLLKKIDSRVVLGTFLFRDNKKLIESMMLNIPGLKNWMKETSAEEEVFKPYTAMLGEISVYKKCGPHISEHGTGSITLKPNDHIDLYFGVTCLTDVGKTIIPIRINVYPISDYKNPKISYKIDFYKGMTFEVRKGELYAR
jgi:hypothetical protein